MNHKIVKKELKSFKEFFKIPVPENIHKATFAQTKKRFKVIRFELAAE